MINHIERMLKFLSDTEFIKPNDRLSEIITDETDDELSESELEYVIAAVKPDYGKLVERLRSKKL